jgi:glycosyltransferase involved in cell wall biosynthesis
MKLLVLAQTPPPLHGQSIMVRTLVEGLPAHGIQVTHVEFRLSRDAADIGRWRLGKILGTLSAAGRVIAARFRAGCDTFYYIPAPGKRGALYRDWVILLLCRPFFKRLVLHWHAVGLVPWLREQAWALERGLTQALLGRANLSIVLAKSLRGDAEGLRARKVAVVANGVADPGPPASRSAALPFRALFLGLGSEDKGLFALMDAILDANQRAGAVASDPAFVLTVAGAFDSEASAHRFHTLAKQRPAFFRHVGIATGQAKTALLAECHAVCCPSWYGAEGLPLVLLEALAHDRPVIGTRWRGIPEIVTADVGIVVRPRDVFELANALFTLRERPPAPGVCRQRYEEHYTLAHHLTALAGALRDLA